jgi:chromate reductase
VGYDYDDIDVGRHRDADNAGAEYDPVMRIVAVSGSLRSMSLNSCLIRAAVRMAPDGVTVTEAPSFRDVPIFDADLSTEEPLPAALDPIRAAFDAADGVLISSPEYAHGMPGGLKNLLDWQVGTGELIGKPTALVTVSTSSTAGRWSHGGLTEVLKTMGIDVIEDAALLVGAARPRVDPATDRLDAELEADLARVLRTLVEHVRAKPAEPPAPDFSTLGRVSINVNLTMEARPS